MTVRVTWSSGEHRHTSEVPRSAPYVLLPVRCACGAVTVRGIDPVETERDLTSDAVCTQCGAARGKLRVKYSTVFGISEDRAVMLEVERAGGRVF